MLPLKCIKPYALTLLVCFLSSSACVASIDWKAVTHKLVTSPPDVPGNRTVLDLDASANGSVGSEDVRIFEALAKDAEHVLATRSKDPSVQTGLYLGPAHPPINIFSLVEPISGPDKMQALDDVRLKEMAIEARWLGLQARMATLASRGGIKKRDGKGTLLSGLFGSWVAGYDKNEMEPAVLCEAISTFDTQPFAQAGLPVTAIFDLDSTVWEGNVMDPFLAVLLDQGWVSKHANASLKVYLKSLDLEEASPGKTIDMDTRSALENAKLLLDLWTDPNTPKTSRPDAKNMFFQIVGMMQGMTVAQGQEAARAVFETGSSRYPAWNTKFFHDADGCSMPRLVHSMHNKGIQVFFLSATLDVLAKMGGRMLDVPMDRVIGSVLEVEDGRYTGKVVASTYYSKAPITRQWLPAPPMFAFGDSPTSDFPMLLESFGLGVMVNPRPALQQKEKIEADDRFVAVWFDMESEENVQGQESAVR